MGGSWPWYRKTKISILTALTAANVIELWIRRFHLYLRLLIYGFLKYVLKGKMELSKEDAKAILAAKILLSIDSNITILYMNNPSQKKKKKLSNIKNQLLFQKVVLIGWDFQRGI